MTLRLDIDRLRINAPASWMGGADRFRALLELALKEEMQRQAVSSSMDAQHVLRVDIPPVTVGDIHDMRDIATEIARRIVRTVRQHSG